MSLQTDLYTSPCLWNQLKNYCFTPSVSLSSDHTGSYCSPLSSVSFDRSAISYRLDSYGCRCFAVADPSTWNSLPLTVFVTQLWVSRFSGVN